MRMYVYVATGKAASMETPNDVDERTVNCGAQGWNGAEGLMTRYKQNPGTDRQ